MNVFRRVVAIVPLFLLSFPPRPASATILFDASLNGALATGFAGDSQNNYLDNHQVIAAGQASFSQPGTGHSAVSEAEVDASSGHVGIYASAADSFADAEGSIEYAVTLDAGDELSVGFAVNGTVTGNAHASASIVDLLAPSRLNYSTFCDPLGCTNPTTQSFVLSATETTAFLIHIGLEADTGIPAAESTADFLHSLGVSFSAPAGSTLIDPLGLVQVPEPSASALLAVALVALTGVAGGRRRVRRKSGC